MSTITFPLYDSLSKDLEIEVLTQKEQDKFMKLIKSFDTSGYEIIYILILCYQMENNHDTATMILPYSGKFINNDIVFDFNEIPYDLKKILYKFAKIHSKKMKEENILKENRSNLSSS
jgi:hypothetical protein